ncbi:adenine nucleotide alpha hydrolase [Raphidocelis subcapitata]|uniref:Adenine nucleotide alpha hydrolase n=1 Tax=Raphidocelis subcapitata TaxID=307507 RepID=A0A2V0PHL5_9CHLO|nr:adenine nucleotide alpha hydrolase [Raphidocelis subcapitata]|eukprot:GBF98512.1 adenine nucleotide alpha hydrolase [Raphidocelis subcapitata]
MGARKILVAVDESKASDATFSWALENLYRQGDEVHLIHVIPPGKRVLVSADLGIEGVIEEDEETKKAVEQHALDFMHDRFERPLSIRKIPYDVHLIRCDTSTDSIGALISSRAESLQVAVVVMAKHNKGAVREFFLGSCTSYVLHHCKQPVVVLHSD